MTNSSISERHSSGEFFQYAVKYGLIAASAMSFFELFLHLVNADASQGLHLFAFALLFLVMGIGIYQAKSLLNEGYEFNDSMIIGIFIAGFNALFLFVYNIIFAATGVPFEVGVLALPITTGFDFAVNAMGNLLVNFGFGIIFSIIFGYLFNRS